MMKSVLSVCSTLSLAEADVFFFSARAIFPLTFFDRPILHSRFHAVLDLFSTHVSVRSLPRWLSCVCSGSQLKRTTSPKRSRLSYSRRPSVRPLAPCTSVSRTGSVSRPLVSEGVYRAEDIMFFLRFVRQLRPWRRESSAAAAATASTLPCDTEDDEPGDANDCCAAASIASLCRAFSSSRTA